MKLGYNEHPVITNKFFRQIGHFSAQIDPVITNPGHNEQKMAGPELFVITEFDCTYRTRRYIRDPKKLAYSKLITIPSKFLKKEILISK